MNFDKSRFKQINYKGKVMYFDTNYKFQEYWHHKKKTKRFLFHKSILNFLDENPSANVYFTLDESLSNFNKFENDFLINIDSYFRFCKSIQSSTRGRARAFLGQHLKAKDILLTQEEKKQFLKENVTTENLLETIKNLDKEKQVKIINALQIVNKNITPQSKNVSKEDFISAFTAFLTDEKVQFAFIQNLPRLKIEILKNHLKFLRENLDKDESFVQNWLDEDDGKYRKQRCLIFGLEFIDHKREGELSGKRFDVLTRQSESLDNDYVLIELKSPSEGVFNFKEITNKNGGKSIEYELSSSLSRAIPQILNYKHLFEKATDEDLARIDVRRGKVSKCLIIIGTRKSDDVVLERYLNDLNDNLSNSLHILTYTDLIHKLEITIKNLEENL